MESMQIPGITYNKTAACQQQQAPSKDKAKKVDSILTYVAQLIVAAIVGAVLAYIGLSYEVGNMTNKMYDVIKDVSLLWMPIIITFYGVISATWGIPYGEQILATLTGLNAALGAVVKYYKSKYDKESEEN